jgi:hypothetical protein
MRVCAWRFKKVRSCESRYSKFVEVFDSEETIQTSFTVTPPVPGPTCDLRCQRMSRRALLMRVCVFCTLLLVLSQLLLNFT